MRLSRNFDSAEFRPHDGGGVPLAWARHARDLCRDYLQPLRDEFGVTRITSGLRSATHNREVGGAPASMHVRIAGRRGAAADLVCARGRPIDWYRFLDRLGCPGLGLYDDHVHADNRAGRARW